MWLFGKEKFDTMKCKTHLKMAVTRIKLQQQKLEQGVKHQRKQIGELLSKGKDEAARIKVEAVLRDGYTCEAYEVLVHFCELLAQRIQLIAEERHLPPDLKEAASTIVWATPRCEGVSEFREIRRQLGLKYGAEWVKSASEDDEFGCNRKVCDMLKVRVPPPFDCLRELEAIAREERIVWTPPSGGLISGLPPVVPEYVATAGGGAVAPGLGGYQVGATLGGGPGVCAPPGYGPPPADYGAPPPPYGAGYAGAAPPPPGGYGGVDPAAAAHLAAKEAAIAYPPAAAPPPPAAPSQGATVAASAAAAELAALEARLAAARRGLPPSGPPPGS